MGPDNGREFARALRSPQWSDNVVRKELFLKRHQDWTISTPLENETREFRAAGPGPDGQPLTLADTSLGWLMDKLFALFGERG